MAGPKDDVDNHANQLNPNNDSYWTSRGEEDRPEDRDDDASSSSDLGGFEDFTEGWEHND